MKTPKDLDAAGLAYWRVVTRAWTLDSHQWEVLRQACRCLDTIAAAEAAVTKDGGICRDRFGQQRRAQSETHDSPLHCSSAPGWNAAGPEQTPRHPTRDTNVQRFQ